MPSGRSQPATSINSSWLTMRPARRNRHSSRRNWGVEKATGLPSTKTSPDDSSSRTPPRSRTGAGGLRLLRSEPASYREVSLSMPPPPLADDLSQPRRRRGVGRRPSAAREKIETDGEGVKRFGQPDCDWLKRNSHALS